MKKNNENKRSTRTKLVATIISMVSALSLLAVGVVASLTEFTVTIQNQLNLKFETIEGNLYATRLGNVADSTRATSKVLSTSQTATDWLLVYDGTTTEGVQTDALTSIQEKVDFVSDADIKTLVRGGANKAAITYYYYYTLPTGKPASTITLEALAPTSLVDGVTVTYAYVKASSATLPDFAGATALATGDTIQVAAGENVFIKAELSVSLTKSVDISNLDWKYNLNFTNATYSLQGDTLNFKPVANASTYEVWAKENTTSGASLLSTAVVGEIDNVLGTCMAVLPSDTTSIDLKTVLKSLANANYRVTVVPKNSSGDEITGRRMIVDYTLDGKMTISFVYVNSTGEDTGISSVKNSSGTIMTQVVVDKNMTFAEIMASCGLTLYTPKDATITSSNFNSSFNTSYWDQGAVSTVFKKDTTIKFYSYTCFNADTEVLVYDEKQKRIVRKKIKDITYNDVLVVWNFDEGKLDYAKPIWIKKETTSGKTTIFTFEDGTKLKVVGTHHAFDANKQKFVNTKDLVVGDELIDSNGEAKMITAIDVELKEVKCYSVISNYHMNIFTNGILTSEDLNNLYTISGMKFVKENRKLNTIKDFEGVDKELFDGFRLAEFAGNKKALREHMLDYYQSYKK